MVLVQCLAIVTISSLFANVASFCGSDALKSNIGPGSFVADDYKVQSNRKPVDKVAALSAGGFGFYAPPGYDRHVESLITYQDLRPKGVNTVIVSMSNHNQGLRKHTMQLAFSDYKDGPPVRLLELEADPLTWPSVCVDINAGWIDDKYITIQVIDTPNPK